MLSGTGTIANLIANAPLTYDQNTGILALPPATSNASGYLSNTQQSVGGVKDFINGWNINGGQTITSVSTDISLASDSDSILSTQRAIKQYISNSITYNVNWLPSVLNFWDASSALPISPVFQDAYICYISGNGWLINDIYRFNGLNWIQSVPNEGDTVYLTQIDYTYNFNGSSWNNIGLSITQFTTGNFVSTNESTSVTNGTVVISGGIGVAKNTFIGGQLNIVNTSQSTSSSSGSVIISGGTGISKDLFIGGNEHLSGVLTITDTSQSTSSSSGSVIISGGIGITKDLFIGGQTNIVNTTQSTSSSSGSVIISGGTGITKDLFIGGQTYLVNTTQSTSSTSGAMIISGGTGITKDLFIGGNENLTGTLTIVNTTQSTSSSSGSVIISGGTGITKDLFVGGQTYLVNTTQSTSSTSGAMIISGGLGVVKDLYVGGNENLTGTLTIVNTTQSTASSTGSVIINGGVGIQGNLFVGGSINYNSLTFGTTPSISTSTGAIILVGGIGCGNNIHAKSIWADGIGTPVSQNNLMIQSYDTKDSYLQNNIQNLSNGINASSDYIATSNNGTDTSGYVDLGINSSNYSGSIGGASDGYLYVAGGTGNGNLYIGTITSGQKTYLFNTTQNIASIGEGINVYPSNQNANQIFNASFQNDLNGTYVTNANAFGTRIGTAIITNEKLDLTARAGYVSYLFTEATPQIKSIKLKYTPNYTGFPPVGNNNIISLGVLNSHINEVTLTHMYSTGVLKFNVYDSTGTLKQTSTTTASFVSGTQYEIVCEFNMTTGVNYVYLDGTLIISGVGSGTRTTTGTNLFIGSSVQDPSAYCVGSISDVIIYNALQKSGVASYTIGYSLRGIKNYANSTTIGNVNCTNLSCTQIFSPAIQKYTTSLITYGNNETISATDFTLAGYCEYDDTSGTIHAPTAVNLWNQLITMNSAYIGYSWKFRLICTGNSALQETDFVFPAGYSQLGQTTTSIHYYFDLIIVVTAYQYYRVIAITQ
jgi:hypothetical protein